MKRSSRINIQSDAEIRNKYVVYALGTLCVIVAIILGILIYSRSIDEGVQNSTMSLEEMAKILEEDESLDMQSASTEIGKSVEEVQEDTAENLDNTISEEEVLFEEEVAKAEEQIKEETISTNEIVEEEVIVEEIIEELSFILPVDGQIIQGFAKDTLMYSITLEEWTTHLGIDIAAEKTSVVKSAEAGIIKTIKNDPRYGLTIVIEHINGMETVYSNLLTTEFIVEGEIVEKNQSIGTVGNTSAFESLEESHLHFEILENGVQVDPSNYIN